MQNISFILIQTLLSFPYTKSIKEVKDLSPCLPKTNHNANGTFFSRLDLESTRADHTLLAHFSLQFSHSRFSIAQTMFHEVSNLFAIELPLLWSPVRDPWLFVYCCKNTLWVRHSNCKAN